jgi:hypothetical protein
MITIPNNIITAIPESNVFKDSINLIVEPLSGKIKRDWFVNHTYFCLPLTIGNQYGFAIKSLKKFSIIWNGGNFQKDIKIEILEDSIIPNTQTVSSHFGMGVVTIQNRFTFRTPPGVNLMTINPPNYWIDGIQHMTGVIETDNLRRDFTFNLKVTRINEEIIINKGDYIGCVLPIPRYFADSFKFEDAENILTKEEIIEEQTTMIDFGKERSSIDRTKPHGNGRRYFNGEDVYGCPFGDHQKKVKIN